MHRQGLMRIVEWGDNGNPWNCRGLVEQEVFVQEGDFFVIADESKYLSSSTLRRIHCALVIAVTACQRPFYALAMIPYRTMKSSFHYHNHAVFLRGKTHILNSSSQKSQYCSYVC